MKITTIVGIVLIVVGVVMGVLHFAAGKGSIGAAAGVLIGGVAVLFATRGGT